ncbi:MAG TPA: nucleotidyltransferase domain-containing protein [Geomonas sp.]|nr:nucleotidyltransferase domain-containing protein [Geomonas sp.]
MSEEFGLRADVVAKIRAALTRFPEIKSAILYGSRAKGNWKPGSDIDLTLVTEPDLPKRFLLRVSVTLDDLDLPYSFDLSLFHCIDNPNVIDHIHRVGIEFYNAEKVSSPE